jgi:hypothetical protein
MDPLRACYAGIKNYYRNALLSTSLCAWTGPPSLLAHRLPRPGGRRDSDVASGRQKPYGSLYFRTIYAKIGMRARIAIAAYARNVSKYAACSHIVQDAA